MIPVNTKYYLLLALVALIAYWPISSGMFSLKNDALTYFLPFRYHISESIQNGSFPLWSPYIYTGLPLHADIQSGVWNPVVLIISLFTTYDLSILQWETLFYIITGGIGFFKLCRQFAFDQIICFTLAASYMCCGFMIDSGSFIPWITSAAWMPFVLLFFLRVLHQPTISNAACLALSNAFLFLAGYPSYFILVSYFMLITGIVHFFIKFRTSRPLAFRFVGCLFISAIAAAMICSPALVSYIDFLPYYERGSGTSLENALYNPFHFSNTWSYLFPSASYKLDTNNDISSRNAYIGIIPLLFVFYSFRARLSRTQKVIAGMTLLSFLFSLGDATPVRAAFYYVFPLLDSFRHPGTARLFTTIGLLLLSGYGMQRYSPGQRPFRLFVLVFSGLVIVLTAWFIIAGTGTIIPRIPADSPAIKFFIDHSNARTWVAILAVIQLAFLSLLLFRLSSKRLCIAAVINIMLMAGLAMPFTMVSQYSTAQVNQFLHSFPGDFPLELANKNVHDPINEPNSFTKFGYLNFYTKQISIQDQVVSPTVNAAYGPLLRDTGLRKEISRHPFIYLKSGTPVQLKSFTPNYFKLETEALHDDTLFIVQQYNDNWRAFIDGKENRVWPGQKAFMKIFVPRGSKIIQLEYKAPALPLLPIASLTLMIACVCLVMYFRLKS